MYIYHKCQKRIVKLDCSINLSYNWHMLVNISTISSSTSSSRAEILLHVDGRISAKLHSAEYVIETKGRPEKKLKKMLHVILTVKHTYKLFTLTGRNPS